MRLLLRHIVARIAFHVADMKHPMFCRQGQMGNARMHYIHEAHPAGNTVTGWGLCLRHSPLKSSFGTLLLFVG